MKLGIVSAIYDGFTFEEMIDHAAAVGYECVEVACWPQGKAERRYAGVSHIDVDNTSEDYIRYIRQYCADRNMQISSLAFYPNTMDGDPVKRAANIAHLKKVIHMSALLGVGMVTTFIGVLLSNVITADEATFMYLIVNIGLFFTGLLLFTGMVTVHQFTVKKSILALILTIAAMAFIAFLAVMFMSIVNDLINFIKGVIVELELRM